MGRISPALKWEREENARLREQLARHEARHRDLYKPAEDVQPCTDGGCVWGHPGGMHTNGGCRCLDAMRERHPDTDAWLQARKNVKAMRDTIAGLRLREEHLQEATRAMSKVLAALHECSPEARKMLDEAGITPAEGGTHGVG